MRRGLVAGILLALVSLSIVVIGQARQRRVQVQSERSSEGLAMRRVRHVHYRDGTPVLRISLDEASIRRPKLGAFRIGFARELVASNVAIEMDLGTRAGRLAPREIRAILDDLTGTGASGHGDLTSVTIRGVQLRMTGAGGSQLTVRAGACMAGLLTGGRMVLRDGVVVTTGRRRYELATLELDPAKGTFVAATPLDTADRGAATAGDARQRLRELNCILDHMTGVHDRGGCSADEAEAGQKGDT